MFKVEKGTREVYTIIKEDYNRAVLTELNEQQKKILQLFVEQIQSVYPLEAKDLVTLVKFLRARNFILDGAKKQFYHRMDWIKTFQPHKLKEEHFSSFIQHGSLFLFARDKHQRPIIIFRSCNHFANKDMEAEQFRFVVYMIETGILQLPPPPYDQFVFIFDQSHSNLSNLDFPLLHKVTSLSTYYPDLLYRIIVLNASWFFQMIFKVAKSLLDSGTLAKVQVYSTLNEAKLFLQTEIGEENLPISMGGSKDLIKDPNILAKILPRDVPLELAMGTKRLKKHKKLTTIIDSL